MKYAAFSAGTVFWQDDDWTGGTSGDENRTEPDRAESDKTGGAIRMIRRFLTIIPKYIAAALQHRL